MVKCHIKLTNFTIFYCVVQWHLVHSQCCTVYTTIISRTLSISQTETLFPVNSNSTPASANDHSAFCLYGSDSSRHPVQVEPFNVCPFMTNFCLSAHVHVRTIAQSGPNLCDPMDCGPPGSSVHGILQARIPEWVSISSSRGSSPPRDRISMSLVSPALADGSLSLAPPGKPIS